MLELRHRSVPKARQGIERPEEHLPGYRIERDLRAEKGPNVDPQAPLRLLHVGQVHLLTCFFLGIAHHFLDTSSSMTASANSA